MKTVAVICEYNPFHLGHLHQIHEIRRKFGEETAIVAIMSGNFTERGDVAILGKFDRARIAVDNGISLVLELPFPFSASCAEVFAQAAVSIADKLGCIDVLSFGSECGNIAALNKIAERTSSPSFVQALSELAKNEGAKNGHAKNISDLYQKLYGEEDLSVLASPNNILAIEYLKALKKLDSSILPHTVKRDGTDKDGGEKTYAGATFIRSLLVSNRWKEAFNHMPSLSQNVWEAAFENGFAPAVLENLSLPLLSSLRLNSGIKSAADCQNGLYEHLQKAACRTTSLSDFFKHAATKKYTDARIRRATLFSYFGVTPSMLSESILYTQVLAMDALGMRILHDIRKSAEISILTKPADLQKLPVPARAQAEMNYRADSIYALASPTAQTADVFVTRSPYRK